MFNANDDRNWVNINQEKIYSVVTVDQCDSRAIVFDKMEI